MPGIAIIEVSNKFPFLSKLRNECGGHRIQRIPPTERRGRVHTSTVTVALTEDITYDGTVVESDLRIEWFSGSGAGGQHRNKTQNSVRMQHIPTGILVTAQTRKRSSSLAQAKAELERRLSEQRAETAHKTVSHDRKLQVGSGMRGDKIRTYRFQDDSVTDHRTGKSASVKKVMRGGFNLLW